MQTDRTIEGIAEERLMVQEFTNQKKVPVIELFGPTIQGEGPLVGTRTLFIRFGGCDFRCGKCDSPHAVLPHAVKANARRMTQEELAKETIALAARTHTRWVTFSGGNPCMWNLSELVEALNLAGIMVAVETQGTLAPEWLSKVQYIVTSPKSPGMEEKFDRNAFTQFLAATGRVPVALKVVVFSALDMEFALEVAEIAEVYESTAEEQRTLPITHFLSLGNPWPPEVNEGGDLLLREPGLGSMSDRLLAEYRQLLEDFLNDRRFADWIFLPQLHVLVWGNEGER